MRTISLIFLGFVMGCSGGSGDASEVATDSATTDDTSAQSDAADDATDDASADADDASDDTLAPADVSVDAPADVATADTGTPKPTTALLRPDNPLPCADPAVVSDEAASKTYYVYCTSMSHVWKTTDWVHFNDVRSSVTFTLAGMSDNGKMMGSWWAPGIVRAKGAYVMWVSVPDAQGTNPPGGAGWDTRSLAVLTATAPDGPWDFKALAIDATVGQQYIDPFPFLDADGSRYVYWKQYGGGLSSSIMGARVDAAWTGVVAGSSMEVMHGYGGTGTWEDNVRENPAVLRDSAGRHHLIFSGGHWFNDTYATGHALSTCGPLCPESTAGGWHMVDSGDRGILQVVRTAGLAQFANGGAGGAVFLDDSGDRIVYAAAAKSASGDKTRYLMLDAVQWQNKAPFVDTAGHHPLGY